MSLHKDEVLQELTDESDIYRCEEAYRLRTYHENVIENLERAANELCAKITRQHELLQVAQDEITMFEEVAEKAIAVTQQAD